MTNEADTCRKYVLPKLIDASRDNDPHSFTEQKTFTDAFTTAYLRLMFSDKRDLAL